jgi:hypothetical protein
LKPLVNAPNAQRRQQAVLASYTLRDNTLNDLPLLVMQRLNDPDASVRAVTNEFYKSLPLKVVEANRNTAVAVLRELLASKYNEAQIAALERLKTLGGDFAGANASTKTCAASCSVKTTLIKRLSLPLCARSAIFHN